MKIGMTGYADTATPKPTRVTIIAMLSVITLQIAGPPNLN